MLWLKLRFRSLQSCWKLPRDSWLRELLLRSLRGKSTVVRPARWRQQYEFAEWDRICQGSNLHCCTEYIIFLVQLCCRTLRWINYRISAIEPKSILIVVKSIISKIYLSEFIWLIVNLLKITFFMVTEPVNILFYKPRSEVKSLHLEGEWNRSGQIF